MRYIDGIDRKRKISFPESLDDYITEDNPVRIIDAFVDSLDLEGLGFKKVKPSDTGRPGHNPRTILKLYIWVYEQDCIITEA